MDYDDAGNLRITICPTVENGVTTTPTVLAAQTNIFGEELTLLEADSDEPPAHTQILPGVNDSRWVEFSEDFDVRGLNISFRDFTTKNMMSVGIFLVISVFYKDSNDKISRIGSSFLGSGLFFGILSYLLPKSAKTGSVLFQIASTGNRVLGNSGAFFLIVDDGKLKIPPAGASATIDTPSRITFDYSRMLGVSQFGASGCCGHLVGFNHVANTIQYIWGFNIPVGTKFKLGSYVEAGYNHPPGISLIADYGLADSENSTLILRGSIAPVPGTIYKVRILSGTFGTLQNNTLVTFASVEPLTAKTWRVTVINTNSNAVRFPDKGSAGSRFMFFSPLESPELTMMAGNQISADGGVTALDLMWEIENQPITLSPGTASIVTQTGHGFTSGDIGKRFRLGSTSGALPANCNGGNQYVWLHSVINANTYYLAGEPNARCPIVVGSGGANMTLTDDNGVVATIGAGITAGTAASVTLVYHGMSNGAIGLLTGSVTPGGYAADFRFCVNATNPSILTFTAAPGGFPLAFLDAGSSVQLSLSNSRPSCQMFLSEYWLTATAEPGAYQLRPTENGTPFEINTPSTQSLSFRFLDKVNITGEVVGIPFA